MGIIVYMEYSLSYLCGLIYIKCSQYSIKSTKSICNSRYGRLAYNRSKLCTIFSSSASFFVFFSNRALIRPLPSQQMFEHVQKRHRVFFVYIGGESPLKVSDDFICLTHKHRCIIF